MESLDDFTANTDLSGAVMAQIGQNAKIILESSTELQEAATDWVAEEQAPHDVFNTAQLKASVNAEGAIQDYFDLSDMREYLEGNYPPTEIFEDKELSQWAEENDYIHKSDCTDTAGF